MKSTFVGECLLCYLNGNVDGDEFGFDFSFVSLTP